MQNESQSDRRFDIAADDGAGLRDTDMQRMIRLCRNQLVRLHAHHHIGGFDADDQIVIPHQMYFIEGALENPLRRHTVIFFHKIFFQRSTVDADTDRNTALFCGIHHCAHTLCTSDISRIDADLIRTVLDRGKRQAVIKMNICHNGNAHLLFDLGQCLRRLHSRHGAADNITSGSGKRLNLRHSCSHVLRLCICHGLDQDRIASADHPVANFHYFCHLFAFLSEQLADIVKKCKEHECKQQHHANKMHHAFLVGIDALSADHLDNQKQ